MVLVDRFGYFWAEVAFIQFPVWTEFFGRSGLADMRISQLLADVCVSVKLAALVCSESELIPSLWCTMVAHGEPVLLGHKWLLGRTGSKAGRALGIQSYDAFMVPRDDCTKGERGRSRGNL